MFEMSSARKKSLILYLLITVMAIALFVDGNETIQSVERGVQDSMFRFRSERSPSGNVIICALDDVSNQRMGWPMQRDSLAMLLRRIKQAGASVVVCDFDWRNVAPGTDATADSTFWPALASVMDNVILPLQFTYADLGVSVQSPPPSYHHSIWTERFPAGSAVSAQAMTGPEPHLADSAVVASITPMLDGDRKIRSAPLLVDYGGVPFSSSALWAASLYQDVARTRWWLEPGTGVKIAEREVPTDKHGRLLLNFLGGPRTFRYISATQVLDEQAGSALTKKIVVLSPTSAAGQVMVSTRMADDFPLGEVTATAIENMVTESYVLKPAYSTLIDLLLMVLIGVFAAIVLPKMSVLYRVILLGATLFVMINVQYFLFTSFGWLSQTFYPSVLVLLFMVVSPFVQSEEREDSTRRTRPRAASAPPQVVDVRKVQDVASVSANTPIPTFDSTGRAFDPSLGSSEALPSSTMRLDSSSEPTRMLGTPALDFPTRQMPAGENLPPGNDSESLFQEDTGPLQPTAQPQEPSQQIMTPSSPSLVTSTGAQSGAPEAGTTLGRYRILEEIGRGAMGIVYRGIDPAINRPVALKTVRLDMAVPSSEKEELRSRLLREAQAAGQLSHPNIVTIFDVGSQGDVYYIAMEYLKGYTLERAVQKRLTLNYKIFAKLMIQVCDALEYAHTNELVHRDVKPANIMVLDNFRVKVMDFGIARVTNSNMTQTGVALGTPSYISPEQLSGHGVDRRSDIFSLGVVMYELLTKDKPFAGESINKLIYNILNSAPRRPTQLDENIPAAFDKICLKALEKDPRQRYQYAADLSRDLKEFIGSLAPKRMVI